MSRFGMAATVVLVIGACIVAQTANTPGVPVPRSDAPPERAKPPATPGAAPLAAVDSSAGMPSASPQAPAAPGESPPPAGGPAPTPGAALPLPAPAPLAPLALPVPLLEARTAAREAYVYGMPLVSSYAAMYAFFADKGGADYKGPFNTVLNVARVFTPDDKDVLAPNPDTLYTFIGLDLRAGPIVLTLPPIDKGRYFAFQLMDLYTYNFAYIGTRTTGNGGGRFLIAGPGWTGTPPGDITQVIRADTELVNVIGRTQLLGTQDLDKAKAIQAGYKLEPLATVGGQAAPAPAPPIDWLKPSRPREQRASLDFYDVLAFALQFAPPLPSETALRERFASIGIVPGKRVDVGALSTDIKAALYTGMAEGQRDIDARRVALAGKVDGLFGTRDFLGSDYVARAAGSQIGLGANSREEALYPLYELDAKGLPLDGAASRYILRFGKGKLPPVNAFWSLTLYDKPDQRLVANPIDRYQINASMLPSLKRDPDGGLTIHIQSQPPGGDKNANWLPAPAGPFVLAMRYYWPKPDLLAGKWAPPKVERLPEPKVQEASPQRSAARPARAAGR